jgi:putative aldouronate transport system permease protein
VPIILALITTEMRGRKVKKIYQTVLTFPHFLSWVVVSAILISLFSEAGAINSVLTALGLESIPFLSDSGFFRGMLFATHNWKEMGWASIIYMATISSIDPGLYEAAEMDGASKLRQMWHITLPGIAPTVVILLILRIGNLMSLGWDRIYLLYNDMVMETADVISTYVYRTGMLQVQYSYATAVGLMNSIVNIILLFSANFISRKVSDSSLW